MLKEFKADLHIHTCLSPCAEPEMTPRLIVKEAIKKGLDLVGICDHNSSENAFFVKRAAYGESLNVLAGVEMSTKEEVHILALFDNGRGLSRFQKVIYENLTGTNDEKTFGEQLILNEKDELIEKNARLLIGAVELPIATAAGFARSLGGLVIASHADRESFSIFSQLGFVPEGLEIDALEVSPHSSLEDFNQRFNRMLNALPLIFFSDAHCLRDIGRSTTTFFIEQPTIPEIKKALQGVEGRKVII